jgi:plasmid stability protein
MAEKSRYDEAMPHVEQHLHRYERALAIVRKSHRGRSMEEVREALLQACALEGVSITDEAADDAAYLISSGK